MSGGLYVSGPLPIIPSIVLVLHGLCLIAFPLLKIKLGSGAELLGHTVRLHG